jgi:hypothetical protein
MAMSDVCTLSLRIYGELPPTDDIIHALTFSPSFAARKGDRVHAKRTREDDMYIIDLETWTGDGTENPFEDTRLEAATKTMRLIMARLDNIDLSRARIDAVLSIKQEVFLHGYILPNEFIKACAELDIPIGINVLIRCEVFMGENDEDSEDEISE